MPITCDIYSLGIILLKMASLDCYYSTKNNIEVYKNREIEITKEKYKKLWPLIEEMIDKNPKKRIKIFEL